ncbi:amino acid adenylation domain-containing protein [Tistlia consotensis]|uniref:Amino acid adenylation domain-containing protein n=1 Tax=Tistlia consotensis USBA 355 TaxID=560819 RepID=A0A1Y6CPT5_9PROT|nr:non-ribosomal peptide synthetase [Tistlia consotensis]SMF69245.1 amino acid adenylation domain-containing protein [Tistlia consotensis USBA 355]SNS01937.1 amino acid adenylation domain-containing protein [Tistlia consotensis]
MPIAVVGLSGRFPGAPDVEAFWDLLSGGGTAFRPVPPWLWDAKRITDPSGARPGTTRCAWAGMLDGVDRFDAGFFGFGDAEAAAMDPQHRLFLEECWRALEDAGCATRRRGTARWGVIVGGDGGDYGSRCEAAGVPLVAEALTGTVASVMAARIAAALNLKGGALAVDAACASALAAVHLACQSLRRGETDLMVAGGTSVRTMPRLHILCSQSGMVTAEPLCRPFDEAADGFVIGDAVAALVLKRLPDAERDGDRIHGVIRGSAMNHNGGAGGLSAAVPKAQAALLESAWAEAGIEPDAIGSLESNGTASLLGDAIEVRALTSAFRRTTERAGFCALGSVKGSIGHCLHAAGVTSLIKLLLSLRHHALPPCTGFERPSRHLDLEGSPFFVNGELRAWEAEPGRRRLGAVSAFGFNGTNVHMVVEEAPGPIPAKRRAAGPACLPIVLSGHEEAALARRAADLLAWLDRQDGALDLAALACTLIERPAFAWRAAFVAAEEAELRAGLARIAEGREGGGLLRGRAAEVPEATRRLWAQALKGIQADLKPAKRDPKALRRLVESLAALYVQGGELPVELLVARPPQRLGLPPYPFGGKRYWVEIPETAAADRAAPEQPAPAVPAPVSGAAVLPAVDGGPRRDPTRDLLCRLVAERLGRAVAPSEETVSFVGLGLRSLDLVRLIDAVGRALGVALPASLLFDCITIQALAAHLEEHHAEALQALAPAPAGGGGAQPSAESPAEAAAAEIPAAEIPVTEIPVTEIPVTDIPLTVSQQGVWVLQQNYPGMAAYNVPLCLRVDIAPPGALERLRRLCAWIGERWPIMTAAVAVEQGRPLLRVGAGVALPLEEQAADGWSEAERVAWLRGRGKIPFDLAQGPLARLHVLIDGAGGTAWVLLCVHHLVTDGSSLGRIVIGLRDGDARLVAGRPLPGPDSFEGCEQALADEAARLAGAEGERRRAYWRAVLAGLPGPLDLPLDRPRPAERSYAGATLVRAIPGPLVGALRGFARDRGLFASTVLLGAWQALLARLSGQQDLVVGMPMNERGPGTEELVGLHITMLPVRCAFGMRPLAEALQRLQRSIVDGMAHVLPFPALVQALGLAGGAGRDPVFQAAYFFHDAAMLAPGAGEDWRWIETVNQEGEYELVLEVWERDDSLELHLKYASDLFEEPTIACWAGHLLTLIEALVADAERPLAALPLLSAAERDALLAGPARGPAPASLPSLVPAAVARQAAERPEAVAVSQDGETLSYATLWAQSGAVAAALRARGVGRGDRVGLCLERRPQLLPALLGILRAGAAYLPLDPAYPAARLDYMVRDSGAAWLLGDRATAQALATLAPAGGGWLDVEDLVGEAGDPGPVAEDLAPDDLAAEDLAADDLAYVIYTSGSTGRPKGVAVSHGALANLLTATAEAVGLGAEDRLLAVTTLCFDIAGLELLGPLVAGGTVALASAETARDGQLLAAELERVRPTVMQATPSTWAMLLHAGWRNRSGVRVLCGGEALPAALAGRLTALGAPVWNLYGPTEATIWSTLARVEPGAAVTIGRPLAGTEAHVLDERLEPAPVGVAGHLYLGGRGLARGYWGLPGRTAEAFVASPFGAGARLYRTGDLARRRADGGLEYLGRADQQVKVQGHRIELGEIEARLEQQATVRRAAVVARPTPHGSQLVAWCEPASPAGLDPAALKAALAGWLPAYMVPAVVVPLDALPQTANGKIDRKALAARDPLADGGPPPVAPAAAVPAAEAEARVRALWAEVLERPEPARDVGFFELGGTSVAAVLLAARLAKAFGRPVRATDVFRLPTVVEQAAWLGGPATTTAPPAAAAATPRPAVRQAPAEPSPVPEDALAIIGIACTVPGAVGPRAFWELLESGRDSGRFLDAEALRAAGIPEATIRDPQYIPVARAIEGRDLFDAEFFNLSARNAALMDPQHRLLLQHAWAAVEDAGYTPEAIPETAVFTATSGSLHRPALPDDGSGSASQALGSDGYVAWLLSQAGTAATTISYQLGLTGTSCALHTNCSSSLVALQQAAQALASGDVSTALVGACSLLPEGLVGYRHEPGLNFSGDGHCKTFDARADGMVAGEGVAVVLLKRARDALADGDAIHALIRGVASNNDGQGKAGFYAPSVAGQVAVIGKALARSGVDPATIGYVEAHGTGTALGDPIEIAALSEVYRRHTDRRQYCAIGSVKTNLGHTDTAAGLAGLIKVALSLERGLIPPSLHYESPNPEIDFASSPFRVAERLQPWPAEAGRPRRGAVSAFGIGGTNAHAILEEAPKLATAAGPDDGGPALIVLSARSEARLSAYAEALLGYLERESPGLRAMAHTLQTGRRAMAQRLAFVAPDLATVRQRLADFLAGRRDGLHAGEATPDDELLAAFGDAAAAGDLVARWQAEGKLDRLAALWVRGLEVDWRRLYPAGRPRRIGLPTYPFAPECDRPEEASRGARAVALAPATDAGGSWDGYSFLPHWQAEPSGSHAPALGRNGVLLIVAPAELQEAAVSAGAWYGECRPDATILQIWLDSVTRAVSDSEWRCRRDDPRGFAACLGGRRVDTAIFLGGAPADPGAAGADPSRLCGGPASEEANLLRLVAELGEGASTEHPVNLYLVTLDRFSAADGLTAGGIGGLAGLGYAIAQGDRRFRLRSLDVEAAALLGGEPSASLWPALLAEPPSERGGVVRFAAGERFRQVFRKLDWGAEPPAGALRHGGLYLLVGGAGMVGRVVSRHLMARYGARIVWIGRRPADSPEVGEAFAAVSAEVAAGAPQPVYLSADAADAAALDAAVAEARRRFGRIDGAFHTAMAIESDVAGRPAEEALGEVCAVKTRGLLNLHRALEAEGPDQRPDFLCVFSSVQAFAFLTARETAAYAAAVAGSDSLVRALSGRSPLPLGLIHWGYLRTTIAGTAMAGRIEGHYDMVADEELCGFLEQVLAALSRGTLAEATCVRASRAVQDLMPVEEPALRLAGSRQAPRFLDRVDAGALAATVPQPDWSEIELRALALFWAQLRRMGILDRPGPIEDIEALRRRAGVVERHGRWWREVISTLLPASGAVEWRDGRLWVTRVLEEPGIEAAWHGWEEGRAEWLADPQLFAVVDLFDACLRALPEVLSGKARATDVIFPDGSLDRVAGLYAGRPYPDSLNLQVAAAVEAFLRHRREADGRTRLRVLEIGAGTGGTSAKVLPVLDPWGEAIGEYCFTDVSGAFLLAAQERFGEGRPWFRTARCDIARPLAGQGLETGAYDLVIATNCLHATPDMRATLRHATSALAGHGLLVVNEGVDKSTIGTLIFGLLDGWWLSEDEVLRVPGSPLLGSATWQRLLRERHFTPLVLDNPGVATQQVILAESRGLAEPDEAVPPPAAAAPIPQPATSRPAAPAPGSDLVALIRACLAETLKGEAARFSGSVPFSDYGLDSILGVTFVKRLGERLGTSLERTLVYDYATIDALAGHLRSLVSAAPATEPAAAKPLPAAAPAPRRGGRTAPDAATAPIAVVGFSLQLPGAGEPEAFWDGLIAGRDGIGELPPAFAGDGRRLRGALLADRDGFDAAFFDLPEAAELAGMSRHQRLVLEEGWRALEDAGYDPRGLAGQAVGVFVGAEPFGAVSGSFSGDSDAIVAARLSYLLDLKGPALAVNTACSAGAAAVHLACDSLRLGTSRMALAGGVAASLSAEALRHVGSIDLLSPSGRCLPFAEGADGTVLTEAAAMVVLKRLDDALADGDPIRGVIVASGMNQDGASNGITAPNGRAQEALLLDTWRRFGVEAGRITQVEGHGTGTPLGDAVEGNALIRAFRRTTAQSDGRQGFCTLGTAKTHIGHTGAASGVVGLIKLLLALRHRTIPGPLHAAAPNAMIAFEGSALRLADRTTAWTSPDGGPLTAALNAFGHSGTNVHLVVRALDEAREAPPAPAAPYGGRWIVPLSAPSAERLPEQAGRLLAWLRAAEPAPALAEIAWTLQSGRAAHRHRLAILAGDVGDLAEALAAVVEGRGLPADARGGVAAPEGAAAPAADAAPFAVAEAWVAGVPVDWRARLAGAPPRRLHLPPSLLHKGPGKPAGTASPAAAATAVPAGETATDPAAAAAALLCRLIADARGRPLATAERGGRLSDLGLTSRALVSLAAALERELGVRILPSVLFDHPTIPQLAGHLAESQGAALAGLTQPAGEWIAGKPVAETPAPAPEPDDTLAALEALRDGALSYEEARARLAGTTR